MWRPDDPQGAEVGKVKFDIVPYVRGRLLDIGAGPYKIFPYAITVDSMGHANQFGQSYEPSIIANCLDMSFLATESFDSVFSSHTLEHIQETSKALKEWMRLVKIGGYLVLYLPHKDLYPNIGQPGSNPDHKHDFLPEDIIRHMEGIGSWDLIVNEVRDRDFGPGSAVNEYSFLQIYQKKAEGQSHSWKKPKPEKTCLVIRYGGIGDMIQSSSILKALKEEGHHVVFNTTPAGQEVLKNNPHIDDYWLQDKDQVPMNELGAYFESLAHKFDRVVNLTESVESTLLPVPGSTLHSWSKEARHAVCNQNYLEMAHKIAGVKPDFNPRFYPTDEEKSWARKEKEAIGGDLVVCISLSGSSVHKTYPHVDQIIARLLVTFPDCRVVLMGNGMCAVLEAGWGKEDRVIKRSGVWNIRQSLSFVIQEADIVIGPETGVLNAVGFEDVAKICFLSHSTKENLTKHWKNTTSLAPPPSVSCYPCHRLHYSFQYCHEHENTGTAKCSHAISPDMVWAAILGTVKKLGTFEPVLKEAV